MTAKTEQFSHARTEAVKTIELAEMPDPGEPGLRALLRRRAIVIRFMIVSSGVIRDPVVILTLLASLSRSGMIFAINETAQSIGTGNGFGWSVQLLLLCAVTLIVSGYFQRIRAFRLIVAIDRALQRRMVSRLLRANVDFLLSSSHGQVYSAMTREVREVSGAVVNVIEAVEAIVVLGLAVPYLFYVSPIAGTAAIGAFAFGLVGYFFLDLPARASNLRASKAFGAYCDRVGDMLSGWRELRQRRSRRETLERDALDTIDENIANVMRSEVFYSGSTAVGQSAIIMLMCFVVIAIPVIQGGDTTTMFQVLTIVFLTNGPTELLFNMMPRLSRAENGYFKIQSLEKSLENAQSHALMHPGETKDSFEKIELRSVGVEIRELEKPDAEPFVLGPIDLTFEPGETVFICGGNGSGKTTLMSLITGLRLPGSGQILLDGQPLDDQSTGTYRELFSGVFSGFHLFERAYGFDDNELSELNRRITQLGLSQRVAMAEDRFSTTSLSAGQSRRLALAVALAEQRPIIVLDEFAADQDPANRAFFYDVLVPELAASGSLVIAITHDDHQFHKCDRLIKMAAGKIISDQRQERQEPV
ncbi:cyclic peptide export ABC transporter [Shimia abyssi]|uniref:Putative ATP-binding cassette transporter n=1 Tax=Shimia abyssi TaxID=1662395 RepID=A0A2P8FAJ1_9RHOB|nr:cyclic peptide export ABC transporter [Shimia abyssi]PSL18729.1 putative ATP-binding cassette transporter [Shimia abyssi]